MAAVLQQPKDQWLELLPYLVAALAFTFFVFLAINVLIEAIWEGSPLWPRTSRAVRRASAVLYVPIIFLCVKGTIAQWDSDRIRAVLAGALALAFCWVATMVALDRDWKGSPRE